MYSFILIKVLNTQPLPFVKHWKDVMLFSPSLRKVIHMTMHAAKASFAL